MNTYRDEYDARDAMTRLVEARMITHSQLRLARIIGQQWPHPKPEMQEFYTTPRAHAFPGGYPIAYYVAIATTDDNGIPLRWRKDMGHGHDKGDVIGKEHTGDVLCGKCAANESNWAGVGEYLYADLIEESPNYPEAFYCDNCNEVIDEGAE